MCLMYILYMCANIVCITILVSFKCTLFDWLDYQLWPHWQLCYFSGYEFMYHPKTEIMNLRSISCKICTFQLFLEQLNWFSNTPDSFRPVCLPRLWECCCRFWAKFWNKVLKLKSKAIHNWTIPSFLQCINMHQFQQVVENIILRLDAKFVLSGYGVHFIQMIIQYD